MILSDNETKLDLLNNQAIAKTIVSIIQDSKESVSIGVHGDWGAGKSSILAMVEDLLNPISTEDDTISLEIINDDIDCEDLNDEGTDSEASDVEIPATGVITLRFNSWQYQGFEDAKIALMSAIVRVLQNAGDNYYKNHPAKGAKKKFRETCKSIWKNIDKLSLAKSVGKFGVSLATGTTPLALLDIATRYAKDVFTNEDKRNDFITACSSLLKSTSSETLSYKEMTEFRANYKALFKSAHIEKLVVLIDDLDRCLPKVAIETLEAIRMFLTMEKTAFIIAADDGMIRYSVKEYFPRVFENDEKLGVFDSNRFSDKYLEKLIQVPLHIPRIGVAEAQLYVLLLLIESQTGETDTLKTLAKTVVKKLNRPWALEQLTTIEIRQILGDSYDSVANKVKIAKSIGKILAQHTDGNPRNIKRFVNMLLLRTRIAYNRGFEEKEFGMDVLAKMMLIEQYNSDFYKAIAAELLEDGTCPAFCLLPESEETKENVVPDDNPDRITKTDEGKKAKAKQPSTKVKTDPSKTKYKNAKFGQMLEQEYVKPWMETDPLLAGVDLRPYYFACTEKEDFFFCNQEERLRELIAAVRGGRFTTLSKTQNIKELDNTDAKYIFDVIVSDVFARNLSEAKPPKIIEGLRLLVANRTELQFDLTDYLLTLPAEKLGIWAIGGWDECIPLASDARIKLNEFFRMIEEKTPNTLIKSSVTYTQR